MVSLELRQRKWGNEWKGSLSGGADDRSELGVTLRRSSKRASVDVPSSKWMVYLEGPSSATSREEAAVEMRVEETRGTF